MRFLDTNILLRYFTGDDEEKAGKALELLKRTDKNREKCVTNLLVIFETVFTLESFYRVERKKIKELLEPVLRMRGLRLEGRDTVSDALDIFVSRNISFADAFHIAFMREREVKEIYSYDRDFDKTQGIKRVEP